MKKQFLWIAVTVGIIFMFFMFATRSLPFFSAERAEKLSLEASLQYEILELPDSEKTAVIDAFTKARISWIPEDGSRLQGPFPGKEQKLYLNLVFGKQMFVNLFLFEDDSIVAQITPWQDTFGLHWMYTVKNPEVLRSVLQIAARYGAEQGLIKAA